MAGDEATVTAADIARMAGVGRAAVSNWRKRHEDFPEPVGGTATSPAFSLEAVEAWLLEQGKVEELPLRERVWQQIRAASDDLRLGESVAEATELLRAGGKRGGKPRTLPESVWGLVRRYAREEGDVQATRFLLDRYADVHSRRLAETPAEVADLMARLAGPDVRSVLDPACGLGVLLAAVRDVEHAYGQEQEDSLARLAQSRLALSAVDATVRTGDSLRADAWPGLAVDAVVCHPPFNERNWGYDELTSDPRWEYGLPPKTESELAWVQHALAHLEPGGNAVLLMPATAANRRSGRRIRSNLLRSGTLQAVIGLPPKVASGTGLPVHVWVLRKPSGDGRIPSRVLMAEADPGDVDAIVERWHEFRADPERDLDRPGESRTVPIIDLVDEDVDVTPARHLGARAVPADTYPLLRERLAERLGRLSPLLPEAAPGAGREFPAVGLAELERVGALVIQQAGRFEIDGVGEPVLTDRHLFDGEPVDATRTRSEGRITAEPGDVVVAARGNSLATLVVETPGLLLGPRLALLRPDPARLDPFFLAGFVRTLSSTVTAGTQSGSTRFDPRRAQVPRLSPGEQKRYGEVFRQIFAFEAGLREVSASGHSTVAALLHGLTHGTLTPPEAIS